MKRLTLLIIALSILTACGGGGIADNKKPRIPDGRTLQANVLSTTNYQNKEEVDMDRLVGTINQNIKQPSITTEDIERGLYYAKKEERKVGTPDSWVWVDEGIKSHWISPNTAEDASFVKLDELCHETGGNYVASCVEHEVGDCEYIPESECRCTGSSKWTSEQGCIRINEDEEFVKIESDDFKNGWYSGLSNEKKLNTPFSWVWIHSGKESRWQNPSPK